uniref:class F sortase n=1 Tax=Pseudonocardia lacus TaxID=2835865 RepID=UPI001BDBD78C
RRGPLNRTAAGLVGPLLLTALVGCGGPAPVAATAPPAAPPAPAVAVAEPADGDRLAAPARVRFPGLGVDAPVVAVGVDGVGEMEVPRDVATVGWYRFGPGAGAGSAVLSGHVDDRVQGRGAFHRLSDLQPGDPVGVELADGTSLEYRVALVERIAEDDLPVDRLFARDGAPRLTLVTCGGDFDRQARSYRENVVVTAEPAGR